MKTGDRRNPGDLEPRALVERVIRVDQAGEFGAVRIYEGHSPRCAGPAAPAAIPAARSPRWRAPSASIMRPSTG
jgi:hypothetical protein